MARKQSNNGWIFVSTCLCAVFIPSCISNDLENLSLIPSRRLECTKKTCQAKEPALRFLIIGDTGGLPIYPHYTYAQKIVASAMAHTADKRGADFVINLGDNFYFNGVRNVFDERFWSSFEKIYTQRQLNIPWYIIAGNHDHLGNIFAQQAYTQYSSKWTFPDRLFYKLSYAIPDGNDSVVTVEILLLDTIVLCGNTIDVQGEGVMDWFFAKKTQPTAPLPEYVELAEEQWRWINETLANSTADYLFVAGHYPIYSSSEHGSFACLESNLDPLLRRYNVNAYVSGHDHNIQHIQRNTTKKNGDVSVMNYIVCGAGSRTDHSFKHVNDFTMKELKFRYPTGWNPLSQIGFTSGAFIHAEINRDNALLRFIISSQDVKYQLKMSPRNRIAITV